MLQQVKKFPFGYYVCSLSFTFERLAYYTAKWGIAIFVVLEAMNGGLGLSKDQGAFFSSQIVAWTYITPIIGGIIADRWVSPRLLVPIGELLMALGYFSIAKATGTGGVWLCVILVSIGTGFFKGNVSGINGRQFDNDKDSLTAAFSLQYSFVNIGSFIGTTFVTLIATKGGENGFRTMFMVCGAFMIIDMIWWLFGMRFMGDAGKKPFKVDNRVEDVENADMQADNAPLTTLEKKRFAAIIILTVLSGIFWLFWYLAYMPVYYEFGPASQGGFGWANWNIGSFEMPTAWFDSTNALLCIFLAPIFAAIWISMSKRPKGDWSILTKTALGIMLLGIAIACMVFGAISYKNTGKPIGIWIILLTAISMTVGEILFSPLGNSFISEYAPKKYLGTLLGVWPFIIFFAGLAYGPLYNAMSKNFIPSFTVAAVIIFVSGAVMLMSVKKFERMIHGDENK